MSMTLEKAIKILSELHDQCCQADNIFCTDTTGARCEAVDMAISALQAQDVHDTNVGDTVSRQAAINALCRRCDLAAEDDEPCTEKCNDIKILEKLPFAQPERKTGRWIEEQRGIKVTQYKCSECGRTVMDDTGYDVAKDFPFCHCGADMRQREEE